MDLKPTILIVESDTEIQIVMVEIFQRMLEALGEDSRNVDFRTAETLERAMAIVSTRCHRLLFLISEVMLPGREKAVQAVAFALEKGVPSERIAFSTFWGDFIQDYQATDSSALREVRVFRKPFALRADFIPHVQPRLKAALEEMALQKSKTCPD